MNDLMERALAAADARAQEEEKAKSEMREQHQEAVCTGFRQLLEQTLGVIATDPFVLEWEDEGCPRIHHARYTVDETLTISYAPRHGVSPSLGTLGAYYHGTFLGTFQNLADLGALLAERLDADDDAFSHDKDDEDIFP